MSLVYWFLEGQPDRMDEDGDGIPCETLYAPEVVADVWDAAGSGDHPSPLVAGCR